MEKIHMKVVRNKKFKILIIGNFFSCHSMFFVYV